MSRYRFVVHYQENEAAPFQSGFSLTRTRRPVCELNPKSASITKSLNKIGSMSLTVHKSELQDLWIQFPASWNGTLQPAACALWVLRNETMIWAGHIWDIDQSTDSQLVTLQCEEMIGIYDRMMLSTTFAGNGVTADIGDLINSLLQNEGDDAAKMRIVDFSTVVPGADYLGSYNPQWYEYQKLKIGDVVRQLLGLAGADWHQAVGKYDATTGEWFFGSGAPAFQTPSWRYGVFWGCYGTGPGTTFNGAAGRDWEVNGANPIEVGTISGGGSTAAPTPIYPWARVAFEWGKKTRQTVDHFKITHSARNTANTVRIGGYGSGGLQIHQRYGMQNSLRKYLPKLFGAWDDPTLTTQTLVDNRAKSVISSTGMPTMFLTAQVRQPCELASFDVIALGDRVRCTIKDTNLDWTGKLRIYNITLKLDDRGNEWMLVDLAPDTSSYL